MQGLRLIGQFVRASAQEETAYRLNFWISLLQAFLELGAGVLAVYILFSQVENIHGWTFSGTLALLGVYLTAQGLRSLFIGPSLESLAGMDGEVWSGRLDFTLLKPVPIQFLASVRKWRLFSFFDLLLGLGVIGAAIWQMGTEVTLERLLMFALAMLAGTTILYAILLAFSAFVFWSPAVLFTWVFDAVMQMARYPVGLYPGWLRMVLTWVIPVGLITTVPAEAVTGTLGWGMLALVMVAAIVLVIGASLLFRIAVKRYASASS